MKTDDKRCLECGIKLHGQNTIGLVGHCIPCYHMIMVDDDEDEDFQPCDECDGHDACEDFGCAIKAGLGHLLEKPL